MKRIFLLIYLLFCLSANVFPQSSITVGANDSLTAGSNTNICAGSISGAGTIISTGTWCDLPFPVELTSFTARRMNDHLLLEWNTAAEIQNYGFEIQCRHSASEEWTTVSFVPGHGNSNVPCSYSFLHENAPAGELQYRLKQIDIDGGYTLSSVINVFMEKETGFSLEENYPNPFNPSTVIRYHLPAGQAGLPMTGKVTLKIFDLLGREIATLVNEEQSAGWKEVRWNASGFTGGIYFYTLHAGHFWDIKKMVLIK